MKMERPSEFDKIRNAAKSIEEAIDTVNDVLSKPLSVFDASKCVEAENLVINEIQTCTQLIAEVADIKYQLDSSIQWTTTFLEEANAFSSNVWSTLDQCEAYLLQFGFKPQDSITEDDVLSTESTPRFQNGTPANIVDTSGIQELLPTPDIHSSAAAKLNRELIFDQ